MNKMPRNQLTRDEVKARIERLKNDLHYEEHRYDDEARGLAHKYLNKVLDLLDEYRY
jgi:hypothetical protein